MLMFTSLILLAIGLLTLLACFIASKCKTCNAKVHVLAIYVFIAFTLFIYASSVEGLK